MQKALDWKMEKCSEKSKRIGLDPIETLNLETY